VRLYERALDCRQSVNCMWLEWCTGCEGLRGLAEGGRSAMEKDAGVGVSARRGDKSALEEG
jgi:hypothetical protein